MTIKKRNFTEFDQAEFFEEEIKPKLEEIKRLCTLKRIPFFACTCYAGKKKDVVEENEYEITLVSPDFLELVTQDERYIEFMKIIRGFELKFDKIPLETLVLQAEEEEQVIDCDK